jgi:hypothetical protein
VFTFPHLLSYLAFTLTTFSSYLVSEQSTNPRSSILSSKLLLLPESSREKICQLKLMPALVFLNKASLNTQILNSVAPSVPLIKVTDR